MCRVPTTDPPTAYSSSAPKQEMSGGRVILSTGTLYGALRRLLEDRWIARFEEDEASRDRHAYRLTLEGQKHLRGEVARMKHLTRLAGLRISTKEA